MNTRALISSKPVAAAVAGILLALFASIPVSAQTAGIEGFWKGHGSLVYVESEGASPRVDSCPTATLEAVRVGNLLKITECLFACNNLGGVECDRQEYAVDGNRLLLDKKEVGRITPSLLEVKHGDLESTHRQTSWTARIQAGILIYEETTLEPNGKSFKFNSALRQGQFPR